MSRLVHYKAVGQLVEAFNQMPDKRLIIIGDSPMFAALKNQAGPNVELLGSQPRPVVVDKLCRAKALYSARWKILALPWLRLRLVVHR